MLTQFIDIKGRLWGISWGPSETTTVGDIWFAHVFNLVRLYTKKIVFFWAIYEFDYN